MEKKYVENPYLLVDLGFKDVSDSSTDFARTVLFERVLSRQGIRFQAHFTHYISDAPFATYKENNCYGFEAFTMSVSGDTDPDSSTVASKESKGVIDDLTKNIIESATCELLRHDLLRMSSELSKVDQWSKPRWINVQSMADFTRLLRLLGILSR